MCYLYKKKFIQETIYFFLVKFFQNVFIAGRSSKISARWYIINWFHSVWKKRFGGNYSGYWCCYIYGKRLKFKHFWNLDVIKKLHTKHFNLKKNMLKTTRWDENLKFTLGRTLKYYFHYPAQNLHNMIFCCKKYFALLLKKSVPLKIYSIKKCIYFLL